MSLCWTAKRKVLSEEDMTSRASCEQKLRTFSTQNVLEYKEEALFIKKNQKNGENWFCLFQKLKERKNMRLGGQVGADLRGVGKQG